MTNTGTGDYEEVYSIGNPGFGMSALAYPGVPLPKARRDYDALELSARRLMSGGWALNASYTYSRLYGNYSGLSQSDENGRVVPYTGRGYDNPLMLFNEKGQPVYGPLATDRPHQVKVTGTYAAPFRINASLFQTLASGLPVTRTVAVTMPYFPVMYQGRMSDDRTPVLSQTDIFVQKEFSFRDRQRLAFGITVTNLFNQATVISKSSSESDDGVALTLNEADFYAGRLDFRQMMADQKIPTSPLFMKADGFLAPRSIRLMLKWTF